MGIRVKRAHITLMFKVAGRADRAHVVVVCYHAKEERDINQDM